MQVSSQNDIVMVLLIPLQGHLRFQSLFCQLTYLEGMCQSVSAVHMVLITYLLYAVEKGLVEGLGGKSTNLHQNDNN